MDREWFGLAKDLTLNGLVGESYTVSEPFKSNINDANTPSRVYIPPSRLRENTKGFLISCLIVGVAIWISEYQSRPSVPETGNITQAPKLSPSNDQGDREARPGQSGSIHKAIIARKKGIGFKSNDSKILTENIKSDVSLETQSASSK